AIFCPSHPTSLVKLDSEQRTAKATGIPFNNIIVAATHNHGSPEYWGSLRDIYHHAAIRKYGSDPNEPVAYQQKLVDAWVAAIAAAVENLKPATIQLATEHQEGLAFNRRFHMKDGTVRFNPGRRNPDIVRTAGPVDTELPVLVFREANESEPVIATLTTFAMHTAVHNGTAFSGDFPAILQTRLRDKLGKQVVSLFAEGTAGDVNHVDVARKTQLRGRPEVERVGNALADTVLGSLKNAKSVSGLHLAMVTKIGFAPFQPVSEGRFNESVIELRDYATLRQPFLKTVAAWRDCHGRRYTKQFPDGRKPLEVQAIRLNADTAIVTLPHEVFVEIGLAIKAASPFRNTIVISLAGDVDFYIPTRRAFEEGSYEVTTCPLDPGCGEILLDTARSALNELKAMDN
ncbi:MAG: hypothetical protein AB8G99_08960, partial [Planctomycetaceae bacterium]